MNQTLKEFLACLELEDVAKDRFRVQNLPSPHGRTFGGLLLSQALMAAGRSVPDRPAHSMQVLFLRRGYVDRPLEVEVDRLRDGRSVSSRRVVISQDDSLILSMHASFHAPERGYEHQLQMPDAPEPETFPNAEESMARLQMPERSRQWSGYPRPVEIRHRVVPNFMGGDSRDGTNLAWFRAKSALPDDPLIHQCILAYTSDMEFNDNAYRPHSGPEEPELLSFSSIDHSLWFHAPTPADEWTLFVQESTWAGGARGHSRGMMYARDGRLVASLAQDSLMRPKPG